MEDARYRLECSPPPKRGAFGVLFDLLLLRLPLHRNPFINAGNVTPSARRPSMIASTIVGASRGQPKDAAEIRSVDLLRRGELDDAAALTALQQALPAVRAGEP